MQAKDLLPPRLAEIEGRGCEDAAHTGDQRRCLHGICPRWVCRQWLLSVLSTVDTCGIPSEQQSGASAQRQLLSRLLPKKLKDLYETFTRDSHFW